MQIYCIDAILYKDNLNNKTYEQSSEKYTGKKAEKINQNKYDVIWFPITHLRNEPKIYF